MCWKACLLVRNSASISGLEEEWITDIGTLINACGTTLCYVGEGHNECRLSLHSQLNHQPGIVCVVQCYVGEGPTSVNMVCIVS